MEYLSILFKALSEPLRIRIIHLLLHNGKEIYGEELANALQIPAYRLSRHLKVLKTAGLVHERRESRWVYYSMADRNGRLCRFLRRLMSDAEFPSSNGHKRPRLHRRGLLLVRLQRNTPHIPPPRQMAGWFPGGIVRSSWVSCR